jgi:alpha-glucoside transport system substrate-binding protein
MKLKSLNACLMASAFAAFAVVTAAAAADNVPAELADAFAGKYKGTKVTAFGPFTASPLQRHRQGL